VADGKGRARAPRENRRAEARALESIGGLAAGEGSEGLDPLIHSRIRLGILSALAIADRMSFNELRDLLKTTDGNLSVHARKLEKAGYLACDKSFRERLPHTEYRLTTAGRKALERYLDHMEALIEATRE
jgi:DNA-binding MarR family transcriptional regulator